MSATLPSEPPTLPSPSTFDILPPLHTILSRLLLPTPPQSQSQTGTSAPTSPNNSSFPAATTITSFPPNVTTSSTPLNPKDLAAAISEVRARINEARRVVQESPMGDMTVEELEAGVKEGEEALRDLKGR
ncbi:MAG: hypothetical protein L6R41_001681 [Letrouitia leprolyta]|nr:MAG: hypothetical protein L6R41_001681 [Letrouitia leprolyta]